MGKSNEPHLILLHPPSVYDFRDRDIQYGLINDNVPTSPVFEHFPVGFLSILEYLERHGFSTRIINLAIKMLKSRRFDLDGFIQSLNPMAFGIDLHWLAHAHGSLEVARIVKKHHPHTPVIFGGLSASYYHRELIKYPQVDFVLRGDSTEEPLLQLMRHIESKKPPENVPNLTWKGDGVHVNPLSYVPENLDIIFDYRKLIDSMLKYRDWRGNLMTSVDWPRNLARTLLFCRGCLRNCITCGGSNWALGRKKLALRDVDLIAEEMAIIQRLSPFPIALFGDIRQGDAQSLLNAIKRQRVRNPLCLEFFWGADADFVRSIADVSPNFEANISPESHDEKIRKAFGKNYSNEVLDKTVQNVLDAGGKITLYFMIGLPHQTRESVQGTLDYMRFLLDKYSPRYPNRIDVAISPLVPFIDPGSPAFENPSRYGYRLLFRSLEEHRRAIASPHWKHMLNYETDAMSRDEIVDISYEAVMRVEEFRRNHGLVKARRAKKRIEQLKQERARSSELLNR